MCYPHTIMWHRHNRLQRENLHYFVKHYFQLETSDIQKEIIKRVEI